MKKNMIYISTFKGVEDEKYVMKTLQNKMN